MEKKDYNRREVFKFLPKSLAIVASASVILDNCDKPRDYIFQKEICNVEVGIVFSKGSAEQAEVNFKNFNDNPMYVEILDAQGLNLGWNILFYLEDTDSQPIKVDFGQTITVKVYEIQTLDYDLCDVEDITLPSKQDFEAGAKIESQPVDFDSLSGTTGQLLRGFDEEQVESSSSKAEQINKLRSSIYRRQFMEFVKGEISRRQLFIRVLLSL